MVSSGKKLLVLDINGLLLDTYFQGEARPDRPHDAKVNRFYVYKRAFCEEFIQFSLQNFIVGVWSSAREHNVISLVDFMFKEAKEKLAFIWHQQHCTDTGFRHPDNKYKPVFLKELSKLWEKFEADLPWAKGDYGPSNTLLIDDSPYKAISNPRHTAIFPKTYKATDPDDNFLAGGLLPYLEGLLGARDVQDYIQRNPFGESSISPSDPQWSQILKSEQFKNEEEQAIPAHLMAICAPVSSNLTDWTRPDPFGDSSISPTDPQWSQILKSEHFKNEEEQAIPAHLMAICAPVIPNFTDLMRRDNSLPGNGGAAPQLVGAGHRDKRSKFSDYNDRIPQLHDDSQGYPRAFDERGTGPSWSSRPTSRDTRRLPLLSRRSSNYGGISREADRPHNDFHNPRRHGKRSSIRDYGSRASGSSEQQEGFRRNESLRDFHRGGTRDQESRGNRKRCVDWNSHPRPVSVDKYPVSRTGERSRDLEPEEPRPSTFLRRSSPVYDRRTEDRRDHRREERYDHRNEGRDDRRREERYVHRIEESHSRSKPKEESQFGSKPREGRDYQKYPEKEHPRKRDLSADSGRHSQRYGQRSDESYDQRRSWRSGKNRGAERIDEVEIGSW